MKRYIFILIFLGAAIFSRVHSEYAFPRFFPDKFFQVAGALHLLEFKSIGYQAIDLPDLENSKTLGIAQWAPGYSYLFAIVYHFVPDIIISDLILNGMGFSLLLFAIWGMSIGFKSVHPIFIILLFLFFSISTTVFEQSFTTEILSSGIYFLGCLLTVKLIVSGDNIFIGSYKALLLLSITACGFGMILFRYSMLPQAFTYPLAVLLYGLLIERKRIKDGLLCLGLSIASVLSFRLVFMRDGGYNVDTLKQFRLENLLKYDAIFFNSLFSEKNVSKVVGTDYLDDMLISPSIYAIIFSISAIIFFIVCMVCVELVKSWLKQGYYSSQTKVIDDELPSKPLWFVLFTGCLINTGFISYMSITNEPQWGLVAWTYCQETRYFITTILSITVFIFVYTGLVWRRLSILVKLVWIVSISSAFFYAGYVYKSRFDMEYDSTYIKNLKDAGAYWVFQVAEKAKSAKLAGEKVIVLSKQDISTPSLCSLGCLMGGGAIAGVDHNMSQIDRKYLSITTPTCFVIDVENGIEAERVNQILSSWPKSRSEQIEGITKRVIFLHLPK